MLRRLELSGPLYAVAMARSFSAGSSGPIDPFEALWPSRWCGWDAGLQYDRCDHETDENSCAYQVALAGLGVTVSGLRRELPA
jgi:hypothetical protein